MAVLRPGSGRSPARDRPLTEAKRAGSAFKNLSSLLRAAGKAEEAERIRAELERLQAEDRRATGG